jgi:iron complex transport system permease protein
MKLRYLIILFIVLSFVSLFIGVKDLSPADLFHLTDEKTQVLLISRIPRLIAAIIAGMSLSICGLIMQQLSRNKFVSPTTAGTMECASLGILVAIIVFGSASLLEKMAVAFLFALAGTMLFMNILERVKFKDSIFIPLVGLMFGSVVGSITVFLAYDYDLIQTLNTWFHGDFSTVLKGRYELLYVSVPLVAVAYIYADRFTIAGMGEDFSVNLGLRYRRIVNLGLIIVAAITSAVVLTVGMLPFLGLIVPNIVSLYTGDNLRRCLPHTALLGAVFVLACDVFGRLIIYPYEVSIGLTVGVIGSGVFLYLLLRRRAHE